MHAIASFMWTFYTYQMDSLVSFLMDPQKFLAINVYYHIAGVNFFGYYFFGEFLRNNVALFLLPFPLFAAIYGGFLFVARRNNPQLRRRGRIFLGWGVSLLIILILIELLSLSYANWCAWTRMWQLYPEYYPEMGHYYDCGWRPNIDIVPTT